MNEAYRLSVVTPTYNRSGLLGRLYASLLAQEMPGLEWVVVDDGSPDDTPQVVQQWIGEGRLAIQYHRVPNGGRAKALKEGVMQATGEMVMFMDDDDWFVPGSLPDLYARWESVRGEANVAGVAGLCADENGDRIGDTFPVEGKPVNYARVRFRDGVKGDKKEMVRRPLVREVLAGLDLTERRLSTSYLWLLISARYTFVLFNRVIAQKEYLADGLSQNIDRVRFKSPCQSAMRYAAATRVSELGFSYRLKSAVNGVRYGMRCGKYDMPLGWKVAGGIPGAAMYLYDKMRFKSVK